LLTLSGTEHQQDRQTPRMYATSPSDVLEALRICARDEVKLLIHECGLEDYDHIHMLEDLSFWLMDTFVTYRLRVNDHETVEIETPVLLRPAKSEDVEGMGRLAAEAFAGFKGHFHNDLRLERSKCDSMYVEWARNSYHDKSLADHVAVAEAGGSLVGFTTARIRGGEVWQIVLSSVRPDFQRRGIYEALVAYCINWAKSLDLKWMQGATNVDNYGVHGVCRRFGFNIFGSGHIFHKWF